MPTVKKRFVTAEDLYALQQLSDLRISPDGRYAYLSHQVARYHLPTTQLERGLQLRDEFINRLKDKMT